jgi:hypothetical protein
VGPLIFFCFICCKVLARWYNSITGSAGSVQPRKDREMTANELYELLDANDVDYELIAEFEGSVRLNIEVDEEEEND